MVVDVNIDGGVGLFWGDWRALGRSGARGGEGEGTVLWWDGYGSGYGIRVRVGTGMEDYIVY